MDNKKERISLYVSTDMKDKIYDKADEMGISVSAYIIVAINEYMKQESVVDMADMFRMLQKKGVEINEEA